ncbi:hypothetical protein K3495_g17321, partial [Podosphaera aphanis]
VIGTESHTPGEENSQLYQSHTPGEENSRLYQSHTPGEENSQLYQSHTPGEENSQLYQPHIHSKENSELQFSPKLQVNAWELIQAAKTGETEDFEVCQMISELNNMTHIDRTTHPQAFDIEIDMSKKLDPTPDSFTRKNLTETFPTNRRPKRRPLSTVSSEEIEK